MMEANLLILLLALVLDRVVGDPPWLWARLPHPVVLFGKCIAAFEWLLNRPVLADPLRKAGGVVAIVLLLLASLGVGYGLHRLFAALGFLGMLLEIAVTAVFLAQKSLLDHVKAVADGLQHEGLAGGRRAVSMIVGRDPDVLDEAGVARAALESLAENFADGVVAPAFWYGLLGLPGLLAYKMLNTADSMIGHKSERYLQFGWASARLDDLANWPAARLAGILIVCAAGVGKGIAAAKRCFMVMMADHGLHRSPNSGWPEAAAAGGLDVALAGPRIYAGDAVNEPMMNAAGQRAIGGADIRRGLLLIDGAWRIGVGILLLLALL
ncbi:cobalamin biosynthesis protein [Agrobacterium vitis]|uniref:Cobalamin biosynthesis protein CobD n=1 Tax=Agrobacterium vitis TaxID=373 RepID=A0ABD6G6L7_AGRVI|nr:cobalamin biosynthesis protein [Agrobacterium vitis]MUO93342.1 cobalamin biosynthesis protein [Agrobacterium vitis]MUP04693.1 cobalamin biosynthesis protein [Agrobacterium vitis]MUZ80870.1 cobalamin biosynthesis protein [Agrobacterium vitis]MVA08945.1 cobalamin biosynthesis protein [Agrobacterium vitis]